MGTDQKFYTKEYKLRAVKLAKELGSVTEAAKNLGISTVTLYSWRSQFEKEGENAFPGKGKMNAEDEKIFRLEKEVRQLKMENDFLKKAAGYFASQQK